jgi:flagellar hook-length control protein FliK
VNTKVTNLQTVKSEFILPGVTSMTGQEESDNVQEIVKQTRIMIKDGGGEMKIKLSPEGMGDMDLKVDMKNGKINIDLLSDSPDIRKLIEKGLGDLKATLAAHKLDVDQIKVDTSSDIMKEFGDQEKDAERHFAQQFLGNFRQQNQGFRNGTGFGTEIGMKDQLSEESDNSDENQDMIRKIKAKSSRKLDLVA